MGLPSQRIETTEEYLEQLGPDDHVMVAEADGKVVGVASLEVRSGKLRYCGWVSIALHNDHQGMGIGGRLLDTLLDLANQYLGLVRVELDVAADNEPAINLYKSKGFEIEGRLKKAHFSHGAFKDVYMNMMGRVR